MGHGLSEQRFSSLENVKKGSMIGSKQNWKFLLACINNLSQRWGKCVVNDKYYFDEQILVAILSKYTRCFQKKVLVSYVYTW